MRKAQEFVVYPMQTAGPIIRIQSDTRFGELNLDTGEALLSPPESSYATSVHLSKAKALGTVRKCTISPDELQVLRGWLKSLAGPEVKGTAGVLRVDNTGALGL